MSETATEPTMDLVKQAIAEEAEQGAAAGEQKPDERKADDAFAAEDAQLELLLEQQRKAGERAPEAEAKQQLEPAKESTRKEGQRDSVHAAVIALRKKLSEIAAENMVLKGENQALKAIIESGRQVPSGDAAPQQKTEGAASLQDRLDEIDKAYVQIAEDVDQGKLSMKEAEEKRLELRRLERQLLQQEQQEALASLQHQDLRNDLGLQEHLMWLAKEYPVINRLTREQLEPYEKIAYQKAEMEGNPIPEGPLGTKILRERMAELAERDYDPESWAKRSASRNQNAANAPGRPGSGSRTGAQSSPGAAEREAKLKLAARMPPDIGSMGAGASSGEVTEEQAAAILSSFKDDEEAIRWLDRHPQFVQKVMGRSLRPTS